MYGHYRNSGIRRINNYAQALEQFNTTKPIRGRTDPSQPQVPLGRRSKINQYSIRRCAFTQDIECVLYRTPVVTFKANGEVHIKSDGYDTFSTSNFISEVLGGVVAYIYDHNLCVHIWNENGSEQYRVPKEGTLVLRMEGRWKYVSGAPNNVIHRMNRKAVNQVRKQYQPFKDYVRAMIKLREGVFDNDEFTAAFGEDFSERPNNLRWSWDYARTNKWVDAIKCYALDTSEDKHNSFYKALLALMPTFSYYPRVTLTPERFEVLLNWFITGVHRDEVLAIEALPQGVIRKDSYGQYFRKAWDKYHEQERV